MRNLLSLLTGSVLLLLSRGAAAQAEEFVRVSLAERESVSGKVLMISAYAFIFALLALYALSLVKRQRKVERAALELKRRIEDPPAADRR